MTRKLQAVSLFSGCGGFDLGASQAGIEIIWANDIYKPAAAAYRSLLPNVEFHQGDIRDIKAFPRADVLIGCYPCTGFSLGARRRSRDQQTKNLRENTNNFLYREFMRVLRQVKPLFLFVENVGGMASAESGWFLQRQFEGFRRCGYKVTSASLNAVDFGIAQDRRRLFLVGVRRDISDFQYEFPLPSHGPSGLHPRSVLQDVIANFDEWPIGDFFDRPFHGHYLTRNRKRSWEQPSYTIVANAHHVPLHPMGEPMKYVGKDKWELQGNRNRRLSWIECARIQGLPDQVAPTGNLAGKYRVIGNAVPPALGKAIVSAVVNYHHAGIINS
jgi:DNA (cytosine-5)-methyltransferase 1